MPEKIRLIGDQVLKQRCAEVDPTTDIFLSAMQPLIDSMEETMKEAGGIGLAANQIGRSLRIFILKNDDGTISEYINPTIVDRKDPVEFEGEACLSIPGASSTTKRYKEITLNWVDKNGLSHTKVFIDLKSFAVQHEIDHLDGKLYVDQFGPVKKSMIIKKHKKYLREKARRK